MLIFAVIAFMYLTGEVLKTLTLSILLSFALAPVVRLLEHLRFPRAPAVVLTVLLTLGALGGVGYLVAHELTALVQRLPDYQENITLKLNRVLRPAEEGAAARLKTFADEVKATVEATSAAANHTGHEPGEGPPAPATPPKPVPKVEVVSQPSIIEQVRSAAGPYLEFLGEGSFVLVLVLFILIGREDIGDRITTLFGHNHVSLTTRTTQEISRRISRYLGTFALVNSCYGFAIGISLALIGLPYSVLWGCLAAILRFFPYVGPAVAFILPFLFSFARYDGWLQPFEILFLFAIMEALLAFYLEPVIYGKTTGISALSLLVAAMFWTWMWGTVGLLLSTPLTVCLAVLGKHVPSLGFFATLLGETAEMEPSLRFYQRLIALDEPGALVVIDLAIKERPRVQVFDDLLMRALIRAERDAAREELDDSKQAFIQRVVGEILDRLEGIPEFSLETSTLPCAGAACPTDLDGVASESRIVGLVVDKPSDALALRMLAQLVAPTCRVLEIVGDTARSMAFADDDHDPSLQMVVLSHVPPGSLAVANLLVKRLKARSPGLPILVGLWGRRSPSTSESIDHLGFSEADVVHTLSDARTRLLSLISEPSAGEPVESASPA